MVLLVFCSFPDEKVAHAATAGLVEERLVACGTILPGARSIYVWEGKMEDVAEVMVIFKTTGPAYAKLESACVGCTPTKTRRLSPSKPVPPRGPMPHGLPRPPMSLSLRS